ncbi:hypothetical protein BH11PSE11_BH11PSE11_10590 [soil metagenome]
MSDLTESQKLAEQSIATFVAAAREAFDPDLTSIVLFGSAAEGKLRATSDVNILLVLKRFEQAHADRMREPMRVAHAAVQMSAMFLLESEIGAAIEAFAVKFSDILARHRVLYGSDPFDNLVTPRDALIRRLRQILLNFQLRTRERYILISLREEQLVQLIADAAAPLRSAAASLLQLEGRAQATPKLALEQFVKELNDPAVEAALEQISLAREEEHLEPGTAGPTLMSLLVLTQQLRNRAERLQ